MDADGGKGKYQGNEAGAKYGTGYCDAQCPHDLKFINGEANTINWKPVSDSSGVGHYGSCCVEMDIWCVPHSLLFGITLSPVHPPQHAAEEFVMHDAHREANKISTAYTAHSCAVEGQSR